MPLSEFLRKAGRKLDSNQQKPQQKPPYTDLSSRFENELVELVWENGQVVMQGQSSRVNDLPSNTARARDAGAGQLTSASARFGKFVVPSGDMDLSQDDEIVPWLSYSIDEDLAILPEISGLAANGMSGSCKQTGSNIQSGADNPSKASSFSSKDRLFGSWLPQHRQASDALGSIVTDSSSKHLDAVFRNPVQRRDAASMSTNGSSFLNFSHFSRPATLVKASLPKPDGIPNSVVERIETKEKGSAANSSNPVKSIRVEQFSSMPEDIDSHGAGGLARVSSREPVVKAAQGSCPRERSEKLRRESSIKNDKPPNLSSNESSAKEVERTIEPMVASSSVGSGNSVDRVSCERTRHSKRKCRDIEESDYRSDDVETESVDGKKATHVRGSKRSRAAEVHNLSERRRRDRINEKMRALQELIPNCNKADKASMLDEAIEYLKTLQLRVQIMSMGSGFYMPPMMFPTGMQHMHPAHLPHYQPMGFGMGMADMNGDSSPYPNFPVPPLQAPHFPSPMSGLASFQRMPGQNLPVYGPPGQAPPNPAPKAAYVPLAPRPSLAMGSSGLRNGSSSGIPSTSQVMTTVSSQSMCTVEASSSLNNKPSQLQPRNEVRDQTAAAQDNKQTTGGAGVSFSSATATADINKEPGCD